MRTTVTLDDDTAAIVKKLMRERKLTFKQAVNDAIRAGAGAGGRRRTRRFEFPTYDMGQPRVDLTKALQLAAELEDAELRRRLAEGRSAPMLVPDANVLVYAVNERSADHQAAKAWLSEALGGTEAVGFAWSALLAFIRLTTHPAVMEKPLALDSAADLAERWLSAPSAVVVEPTPRHLPLLRGLLAVIGTAGNLVGDAHLAALALEHDATVVSFDRDFGRFDGLRTFVPA